MDQAQYEKPIGDPLDDLDAEDFDEDDDEDYNLFDDDEEDDD